jgi:hypothetical protein
MNKLQGLYRTGRKHIVLGSNPEYYDMIKDLMLHKNGGRIR